MPLSKEGEGVGSFVDVKYGKEQIHERRCSFDIPTLNGASLEICAERAVAYFKEHSRPELNAGDERVFERNGRDDESKRTRNTWLIWTVSSYETRLTQAMSTWFEIMTSLSIILSLADSRIGSLQIQDDEVAKSELFGEALDKETSAKTAKEKALQILTTFKQLIMKVSTRLEMEDGFGLIMSLQNGRLKVYGLKA
ncbi:2,3-bisphosphoglycerate-dependent phosphoglycerate mutase [Tanacetum coccineum]